MNSDNDLSVGTSAEELKSYIVADLQQSGVLDELKSQLRFSVFKSLQGEKNEKKQLTNRQILISSVISEWLLANG